MEKIIIVEGMHCGHCKNAVEQAVKALGGITRAEVDLAAKRLVVEHDADSVTDGMIRAAIEEEGFTVG